MIELFKYIYTTNGGYFRMNGNFYKSKISYSGNRQIIIAALPENGNVLEAYGDEINELSPVTKENLMCALHEHPESLVIIKDLNTKAYINRDKLLQITRIYRTLYDKLLPEMYKIVKYLLNIYDEGMGKAIEELYINKKRNITSDEINSLIIASGFYPVATRIFKVPMINNFMSSGKVAIQLSKNAYLKKEEEINPYLSLTFATWKTDYDEWLNNKTATLITGIDKQTAEAIKSIIKKSVYELMPVEKAAREIRKIVGLNNQQANWVSNYRELLEIEAQKGNIKAYKIDSMVNTYINKLHRLRALTIARTETISSLNFGAIQGYKQSYVKKVIWVTAPGACPQCLPFEGQIFDINNLPYEDAYVHPNCRCTLAPDPDSIDYSISLI